MIPVSASSAQAKYLPFLNFKYVRFIFFKKLKNLLEGEIVIAVIELVPG
jgi:hypothetical protein